MYIDSFKQHFHEVDDPRQSAKVTYLFFDILFGTLCAVIAGARGWFDIREYLLVHHDWFIRLNMFKDGVPVDDTIALTISGIRPEQFQRCFLKWMASVHALTQGELVAIYGKTLRGSYNRDDRNSTIHMVSAYATANKLILGQLKTDDKINEITAITELLRLLDQRGSLVSIDAMACQARIARTIVEQGGDYLLAVKGNQSLKGAFSRWNGLTTLAMVTSFRTEERETNKPRIPVLYQLEENECRTGSGYGTGALGHRVDALGTGRQHA